MQKSRQSIQNNQLVIKIKDILLFGECRAPSVRNFRYDRRFDIMAVIISDHNENERINQAIKLAGIH